MQTSFSKIVREAFKVRCDVFAELLEETTQLICKESKDTTRIGVLGRLAKLEPSGEALIVGDLHGDLESLVDIFNESDFFRILSRKEDAVLVFLGDYGDRGAYSAEIYYVVSSLKLLFPEQVILMRGNHEGPMDLLAEPHDLPAQLQTRFGENWTEAYSKINNLFTCLYLAVTVEERYLLVHGGLPPQVERLEDLAFAHNEHPKQSFLEDLLWSDPDEVIKGTSASPRGAGRLFGENVTRKVLDRLNVRILIRGHEPCQDGFKIGHNGRVLTLFSRKGPPYFNAYGAYLDLRLSERYERAEQLIPYIHKF